MVIPIFIRVTEHPLLATSARQRNELLRAAHGAMPRQWATALLPIHFTPEAHGRYQQQQRKPSTLARKRADAAKGKALFGGAIDNVWTGFAMRAILGHQEITASATKGTVTLRPPTYIYQYRKDQGAPDKAAEITRVANVEGPELETAANQAIDAAASALTTTKTTTYGS